MATLSKTSMKARHEEVDEPSRIDLEEAVMIAADELGFEDLEYVIDLPTDTTEWLRETMDNMNEEELIDLHKQIEDYKREKELKAKKLKEKRIRLIADSLYVNSRYAINSQDAEKIALSLAKKLKF